ncbi:MAG TPA: hypothetical protein VG406_25095 [Isosphaeraceae bacterium]|jgi:hypothetical protein|nr:hypothetical protein [Isosphaeraceae bacterium]
MKVIHAFLIAATMAAGLAQPAFGQASSGTVSSKGPFLDADIFSVGSDGVYREIYVDAGASSNHQPGGPPAGSAFVFVIYVTQDASGNFDEGFGLIDGTFTIDKKLTSGSITASGTVYSLFDGSPHTVSVSLDLTPSGPALDESYVEHISVGTLKIVNKFSGTDVPATASGDGSIDGVDLGSFSEYFADLGSSKSSTLTISH